MSVIFDKAAFWFKRNLWSVFLFHQLCIFFIAFAFLNLVRRLSGRDIHLGRDPIGVIDGLAFIFLSLAVIFFTQKLYVWVRGKNAQALGIGFSKRRFLDLILGLLLGFIFTGTPWLIALLNGTAFVQDRIDSHFDTPSAIKIFCIAFFFLLLQSVVEETANRAFPLRIWKNAGFAFRLISPAVFFVIIHLPDEQFSLERIAVLFFGGVLQSFAYLLTGNIWLGVGIHTGANLTLFSMSGLWYAGAIVSAAGNPFFSNLTAVLLLLITLILIFIVLQKNENEKISNGEMAGFDNGKL